jgi:DNA-cytosine methyltransferase
MEHIKHIHSPDFTDPMFAFEEPKTKIRYLSLFSGIEAWSCAVRDMPEFEPVAFCEIEEFQSAVLKKHFPDVPNYGDIRNLDGRQFRGIVDLVVGGSPCQDWSCAGKRAGLEGDRSVLALEYIRILEEVRPRWIVFENVPGLLSCNSGADFQLLLQKMDELGYSCSWTILDSQYQFLAQRRRRVFLVGHTGADWLSPAKVLLEPESMCRNPPTRRKAGKDDSSCSENRSRNCGVSGTLCASGAGLDRPSASGNQLDYLVQDVPAYAVRTSQTGANGIGIDEETAHTLDASGAEAVAFAQNQRDEVRQMDVVGALAAEPGMKQTTYIAQVERERERE